MSTDRALFPRVCLTVLLACAVFLLAWHAEALSDTVAEEMTGAQRIAAELDESPVYVDPAYATALSEERVREIEEAVTSSGLPVRVLLVPLIKGGEWNGEAANLAGAVHDRIGGQGHYLVLEGRSLLGKDFSGGGQEKVLRAHYASLTISYEMGRDAPIADQVVRAVEVALSDEPEQAYTTALEEYEDQRGGWFGSPYGPFHGSPVLSGWLPWVLAVLSLLGLGAAYFFWRRPRAVPPLPQHAAFDNADRAHRDGLAAQAARKLVEVGERISRSEASPSDPAATGALQRALDAHAAARSVHDGLFPTGALADIAGVLVLLDMAEDELARAGEPGRRRRAVRRRRHCYANPMHGTETRAVDWRELGGRRTVKVPLCADCAQSVRSRRRPRALPDEHGGRTVPYYEVPAEESVWAATGFGVLSDDLVDRVLRGDHTRTR